MNDHPKAIEAQAKAAKRREEKAYIKQAIADHNIRFHAVNNYTFCYRVDRRNVMEVSSAIRHPNDKPDSHAGRMLALERFIALNRMHIRLTKYWPNPRRFLSYIFGE